MAETQQQRAMRRQREMILEKQKRDKEDREEYIKEMAECGTDVRRPDEIPFAEKMAAKKAAILAKKQEKLAASGYYEKMAQLKISDPAGYEKAKKQSMHPPPPGHDAWP